METAGLEQSTLLFNRQIVTTWENASIIYSDSTTQPDSGLKIAAIAAAVKLLTHFCWISETRDFQKMVLMMTKMEKKKQMETYHSSKVYRHQGMAGQEEIVQPDHMAEIWQHVSEPGDEPAEGKNGADFSSVDKIKMLISNYPSK